MCHAFELRTPYLSALQTPCSLHLSIPLSITSQCCTSASQGEITSANFSSSLSIRPRATEWYPSLALLRKSVEGYWNAVVFVTCVCDLWPLQHRAVMVRQDPGDSRACLARREMKAPEDSLAYLDLSDCRWVKGNVHCAPSQTDWYTQPLTYSMENRYTPEHCCATFDLSSIIWIRLKLNHSHVSWMPTQLHCWSDLSQSYKINPSRTLLLYPLLDQSRKCRKSIYIGFWHFSLFYEWKKTHPWFPVIFDHDHTSPRAFPDLDMISAAMADLIRCSGACSLTDKDQQHRQPGETEINCRTSLDQDHD